MFLFDVSCLADSISTLVSYSPVVDGAISDLFGFDLLAQADVAVDGAAGDGVAEGPPPSFIQRLLSNPLLLPISLFVIFYLTFIAPERRKKSEEAKLMASLAKNDRVVTVGGIHGTIVSISPEGDVVTLKIDENAGTRIKVNRSAVAGLVDPSAKAKAAEKSKSSETPATTSAVKDK